MTTFFRLLKDTDKATALRTAIASRRAGEVDEERAFTLDPDKFRKVPNTPFAYWVDDSIRDLFVKLPPFESDGRTVRVGLQTSDDFRFVRAWWEVDADRRLDPIEGGAPGWREDLEGFQKWCRNRTHMGKYWVPFAKGGEYSPYYSDIHLVVNWKNEGEEIKNALDDKGVVRSNVRFLKTTEIEHFFRPGVTWPRRTNSRFGPYALPAGCIFADKGPTAFADPSDLSVVLATFFSSFYSSFIDLYMAGGDETQSGTPSRSYEAGIINSMPFSPPNAGVRAEIDPIVQRLVAFFSWCDSIRSVPSRLRQVPLAMLSAPQAALRWWSGNYLPSVVQTLTQYERIEHAIAMAMRAQPPDIPPVTRMLKLGGAAEKEAEIDRALAMSVSELVAALVKHHGGNREYSVKSFYVDRRIELVAQLCEVNPAAVIERFLSGRAAANEGAAEIAENIVDFVIGAGFGRWDVTAVATTEPDLNRDPFAPIPVQPPATLGVSRAVGGSGSDSEYPVPFPEDGVLTGSTEGPRSLETLACAAIASVLHENGENAITSAVEGLGYASLSSYLRDPLGFFERHLKHYSKSRRKAPIYWPLSTASGSYTIWVYYPRLDETTLYTAYQLTREKYDLLEKELLELQAIPSGERTKQQQKRFDEVVRDVAEVHEFAEEILRITKLPYKPDHDDGVPICAAPLYKLFRHNAWSKYLQGIWEDLESGKYDWAHLAYAIWPDRVREKAREDKSIAIAHGLEGET